MPREVADTKLQKKDLQKSYNCNSIFLQEFEEVMEKFEALEKQLSLKGNQFQQLQADHEELQGGFKTVEDERHNVQELCDKLAGDNEELLEDNTVLGEKKWPLKTSARISKHDVPRRKWTESTWKTSEL
ncbi:uncharacterized protein N0V89_004125 [Didymosphaeria variabile]|uniref:Uncharacterized protein n=1 Tax=Didymosphaeria variabile TaxID=1932322 RepID=A0A9W9CD54_9PLEO|nr:uncharacterized protein N0V89_004125 [Didymosphaeria variabile]KAJ4356097.1 hypothetical protein N0V89_004125 [Didymosphaeria variabile]